MKYEVKLIFTVVVVVDVVATAAVGEDTVVDGTVELPSFKITCMIENQN